MPSSKKTRPIYLATHATTGEASAALFAAALAASAHHRPCDLVATLNDTTAVLTTRRFAQAFFASRDVGQELRSALRARRRVDQLLLVVSVRERVVIGFTRVADLRNANANAGCSACSPPKAN